jgi:organic radical activating enzyme
MPRQKPEAPDFPRGNHFADSPRGAGLLAPVFEVFASIQGEGLYAGQPQVFLRLAGCPLRCRWCDTRATWSISPTARARIASAEGVSAVDGAESTDRIEDAWVTPLRAAAWVSEVGGAGQRPLSVTGGEPLLWPGFLRGLIPLLGERPIHLETAGAHPDALASLVDHLDHVSLDLKLPEDLDPPSTKPLGEEGTSAPPASAEDWAAARLACLEILRGRAACAKVPVASGRRPEDYEELLLDLEATAPDLPLFLQPVTEVADAEGGRAAGPDLELLWALAERAEEMGLLVKVLPQIHPVLALR